jgi:hypothetical protein
MLLSSSMGLSRMLFFFADLVHCLLQHNCFYCTTILSELSCFLGTMPPLLPHAYKFKYFISFKSYEVGQPLVTPNSDKTSSCHGPTLASSPALFSSCSFDPSNANHIKDVPMSLNGSSPSAKDGQPIQFKVGIEKRNLGAIRKS